METGTALIAIFAVGFPVWLLTFPVGRRIVVGAVVLVVLAGSYVLHQDNVQSAGYHLETQEEMRLCGSELEWAKHDPTAESCDRALIKGKTTSYATEPCGGEYNTPHQPGYTACVARHYLTVCYSEPSYSYVKPMDCDALAARLVQFKD
jgi:hypothetical protein